MGDIVIIAVSAFVAWMFWPGKGGGGATKKSPAEVLAPLLADTPTPGRFYQLFADAPNAAGNDGVLAQALNSVVPGSGSIGARRLEYLDAMTRGWNADYYSRNEPTDSWPAAYNFRGINIGPAWLPRHQNAVQAISGGNKPQRTIAPNGSPIPNVAASSFGLMWLPDIDRDALEAGSIVVKPRPDGSDPYYPPKELMDLLA